MDNLSALQKGIAAEHLVLADLILQGYNAYPSNQNCPYDIIVDQAGLLLKVQVKGTSGLRNPHGNGRRQTYRWEITRRSDSAKRHYDKSDFDVLALVVLDTKEIAYVCRYNRIININPDKMKDYQVFAPSAASGFSTPPLKADPILKERNPC